jgi:hypothetical protein
MYSLKVSDSLALLTREGATHSRAFLSRPLLLHAAALHEAVLKLSVKLMALRPGAPQANRSRVASVKLHISTLHLERLTQS